MKSSVVKRTVVIAGRPDIGQPDWRTASSPGRIAIETSAGTLISKRSRPRILFAGHIMNTPWDPLHRAYFNGYALWTYLTTPFLMATPGFEVEGITPWQEAGELWRPPRAVSRQDCQP